MPSFIFRITYRNWLRRRFLTQWVLLPALVLLFGIITLMFYSRIENFLLFYPQRTLESSPESFGLDHEDILFRSKDGKTLHGWYFPSPGDGPVVLFCHGNAGNISHRLGNIAGLLRGGLGVLIFDYRGYGRSEGSPSEEGIYLDGVAAYDYLADRKSIPPDRIVLFGRSLGGAVAVQVALERKVRALIVECAFTSLKDMASSMLLFRPFSIMMPVHYNTAAKIPRVRVPVLVVHGTEDEIVPFSMGKSLFRLAAEPKYFYPIHGAGHNDTFIVGGNAYYRRLSHFAEQGR